MRIVEQHTAGARVCLVHLHGNEENGRAVMLELASSEPCVKANAIRLDDARFPPAANEPWGDDRIPVPLAALDDADVAHNGTHACSVNPNRVLTPYALGIRVRDDCGDDDVARAELRAWVEQRFLPALARCREGGALPVVAFHNNSNLNAGEMDAQKTAPVKGREHDILFVTRAEDYNALSKLGLFSVALQNLPAADDGSLSVVLQRQRYVNVESQIAPENKAVNRAMADAALRVLGAWQCPKDEAPP